MKHFSDESWVDFARGVEAADRRASMAAHLEAGCESCQATVEWISRIQQVASLDRSFAVPLDELVRAARLILPRAASKQEWIGKLRAIAAELIFETGLDWQPAGVRAGQSPVAVSSASSDGGRMVFEAGDYRVHVKIEPPTASEPGEILGEITNRRDPADDLDGVLVQAIIAGRTIRETTANRFGEFLIAYPFVFAEDTMLRLAFKERGVRIDLILDGASRLPGAGIESQH